MKFSPMKELMLFSIYSEIYPLSCFRSLGMNICLFEHTKKEQRVSRKVDLFKRKSFLFSQMKPVSHIKIMLKCSFPKKDAEIMYRSLVAIRFLYQPLNFICRHFLNRGGVERSQPNLPPHHASHKRRVAVSPPILFRALTMNYP